MQLSDALQKEHLQKLLSLSQKTFRSGGKYSVHLN